MGSKGRSGSIGDFNRAAAAVFLEDRFTGDDAFQAMGVSAIHDWDQRKIIHIAERGIQWKVGEKAGQGLGTEH